MQPNDFLLEEFKAVHGKHVAFAEEYRKLENYTIAGTLTIYGILFGISGGTGTTIPVIAWWMVPFVLLVACMRCWSYYIYLQFIHDYIRLVERNIFGHQKEPPPGFETFVAGYHSSVRHLATTFWKSKIFFLSNAIFWFVLLSLALLIAILKTVG